MNLSGIIRGYTPRGLRGAAEMGAKANVVTIDHPDDAHCGLPASRRICVSVSCAAALTGKLPPGVDHPTRCAFDQGGLIDDPREGLVERRRLDCMRLYVCEEAWIVAHKATNIGAPGRCPTGCLGFVQAGGLVPVDALKRAKVVSTT